MIEQATRLHAAVAAVCPIVGIGIGTPGDSATVKIAFAAAATGPQKTAAQAAVNAFDWSQAAEDAWEALQVPDRATLHNAATGALANIDTYLAVPSPTNAQVVAQVRLLSQCVKQVINRLIEID